MLVKVAVASLCHTDSMVVHGQFGHNLPFTASHEGAGTVIALGTDVNDFAPGDRILCGLIYGLCGHCADCQGPEHERQYCPAMQSLGCTMDGLFAEYVVVDAREASLLPANLSFQSAAPLACAGTTVWGGLQRAGLQPGAWVAIVGAGGGLGHLGVQFARALGLRVIGIDARDEALALAQDCGADAVLDARRGKAVVAREVQEITGQTGADSVLVVSDHVTASALGAAVTKRHGVLVQIAQPADVVIPYSDIIFRDVRLRGSLTSSRGEAQKMLRLVADHAIKVRTHPFVGLRAIPDMLRLARSGKMAGKGVVLVDAAAIAREKESGVEMI